MEKIKLNIDRLRLRDIEDFEAESGIPISEVQDGAALPIKAVVALVWVTRRREDPSYTLDQARDIELGDLDFEDEPNPTEGSS